MILALDTSTPATTVAVGDASGLLAERTVVDARRHAEVLMPMVLEAMTEAGAGLPDLTHVVVGIGPGPYTGLRVGVVTALSLADALSIPVLGVFSHDMLLAAHADQSPDDVLVATDARRKEVFWSHYRNGVRVAGPGVDKPQVLAQRWPGIPVIGDGARLYPDVLGEPLTPLLPSAAWLFALAQQRLSQAETFEPARALYLRRPDAKERSAPPPPELRAMRWTDIEAVQALERQLFAVDAWSAELFWSELAGVPETRWYVVAESSGALVGYAGLMVTGRDADVQTVAVAPLAQRQGVGRLLTESVVQQARQRGCSAIMLEVAANNELARTLYTAMGFSLVNRRRDYYAPGIDALVMRLRLPRGDAQ